MSRTVRVTPRGWRSSSMNRRLLSGSRRKAASMLRPARHRARSRRGVQPFRVGSRASTRKVSSRACGRRWNRSSSASSRLPAARKSGDLGKAWGVAGGNSRVRSSPSTSSLIRRTWRAARKYRCISRSDALRVPPAAKPMAWAMGSWNSNRSRSSRRLLARCRRMRRWDSRRRSAAAARASAGLRSPAPARPFRRVARPAARLIQSMVCTSRKPPGLSFRLGSSSRATSVCRPWRTFCSRILAWKKAATSICRARAWRRRLNRGRRPATQRASRRLVWMVMSPRASVRHSDRVRTLLPMGRPTSQSTAIRVSKRARSRSGRASSSSSRTSTSDWGNCSPRP